MAIAAHRSLNDHEFQWISHFLHQKTGIFLGKGKQAMVISRLEKRLRYHQMNSFSAYFQWLSQTQNEEEVRVVLDLLTTNETYFFREEKHFEFMRHSILPSARPSHPFRVWSAASSSGEEAYSLAMLMADTIGLTQRWEIIGTDISTHMVETARKGLYGMNELEKIPPALRKKYCLKGKNDYEGYFLIDKTVRAHTQFLHANLMEPLPHIGLFEVVFLRNVMIYFTMETKRDLVPRICQRIQPGGYLIISHSESLTGIDAPLKAIAPSIYQLTDGGD
jgi:chemotaxis protein methyltransferase CheR